MNKKPVIVYCDDKQSWIDLFETNHKKDFDIRSTNNGKEFLATLNELQKQGDPPDIILIDLFHPKYNNPEEQEKWEPKGKVAIEELEAAIKDAKRHIYDVWEPYGLDMLEKARSLFPDTPIAIYTQQGVSVINDDGLVKVSNLKGEWLLKGRHDYYESARLRNMLANTTLERNKMTDDDIRTEIKAAKDEISVELTNHHESIARRRAEIFQYTSLGLAILIFITPFIIFMVVGRGIDYFLTFGASLSMAFMPKIASFIERIVTRETK